MTYLSNKDFHNRVLSQLKPPYHVRYYFTDEMLTGCQRAVMIMRLWELFFQYTNKQL